MLNVSRESFSGYNESELVIGLVGAVGTDLDGVVKIFEDRLHGFSYRTQTVRLSEEVIRQIAPVEEYEQSDHAARINTLMDAGNEARRSTGDRAILAFGAAMAVSTSRESDPPKPKSRQAYILRSLKRPEEVRALRDIYGTGFYLVGVYEAKDRRKRRLTDDLHISETTANKLMDRDEDEHTEFGQRTRDTFHLSDFFINAGVPDQHRKNSIQRILDILFGDHYNTPTFDEFAMFMAFSSALRSADLSRQVGAVIANHNEILSMGSNDCPTFGGGLYWAKMDETGQVVDMDKGRDYKRGYDSNKVAKDRIAKNIFGNISGFVKGDVDESAVLRAISRSSIGDITEYGRVVHAEMEAILSCARQNISLRGATLYCTTFPCHNCAKHIVASGIHRVIYVEPYPKSKALEFHDDSIKLGLTSESGEKDSDDKKVAFEPFVGIGARRFAELFSMNTGSGYMLRRKNTAGYTLPFEKQSASLRVQMFPNSYLDNELLASDIFKQHVIGERQ